MAGDWCFQAEPANPNCFDQTYRLSLYGRAIDLTLHRFDCGGDRRSRPGVLEATGKDLRLQYDPDNPLLALAIWGQFRQRE